MSRRKKKVQICEQIKKIKRKVIVEEVTKEFTQLTGQGSFAVTRVKVAHIERE